MSFKDEYLKKVHQDQLRELHKSLEVIEEMTWKRLKYPDRMDGIYPAMKSIFPPEAPSKD